MIDSLAEGEFTTVTVNYKLVYKATGLLHSIPARSVYIL